MRLFTFILLAAVFVASLAAIPAPANASGNVNFILGGRGLDQDTWGDTESQGVLGVQVDWGPDTWPVKIAMGLSGSATESDDLDCFLCENLDLRRPDFLDETITSGVFEYSAGVLYRPTGERKFYPYVGGGLAFMAVGQDRSRGFHETSDEDTTIGVYANGGIYRRLGKRFNIGLDGRIVTGTSIELFGTKGDANYGQLGLTLGWGW